MRHREPFSGEGEDALISGMVGIDGDCLYLSHGEASQRLLVVWPALTSWDADAGLVVLANGESVGHGDSVHGGGGYYPVGNVGSVAGGEAADLARECADSPTVEVAVVNNQRDAIVAGERPVDEAPIGEPVDDVGLDGDWVVDELWVDGERVALDPSQPVTVTIDGGVVSGTAACNSYGGTIDWSSEAGFGRFIVSDLSWTEMACDAPVMAVEQAFLKALQAVESYESADGLYVGTTAAAAIFHLIRVG